MNNPSTYKYPSDITREQFSHIENILESNRKHTRPRTYELYDIFNALNYVLKTGCQWRSLPKEYPKWRSVHEYFTMWSKPNDDKTPTTIEVVLKKIGRARAYKKWKKSFDKLNYYRCTKC